MTKITNRPLLTRIAFALLWLFVFTLPFTQMTEIPFVGMISKTAGLLAMMAGGIAVAARRHVRTLGTVHFAMAGFILWSAVTLFWSVAPEFTVQRILTYLQLFVLVLMVWELCSEEKDILHILRAFVLGTIIPAAATLMAFLPGREALYQRAAAGSDPNSLAFILALSLPAAYYLILVDKSAKSALYRLQMGFAVCAILFAGSAVTMIAMAIGLSLVCWTAHVIPMRTRANAFALVVMLGGAFLLFLPASLWQHISEESKNGGITLTSAINSGLENMHVVPLGGFGAGSKTGIANQLQATPPTPFTMFSETGVVGVACFVVLLGVLFVSAERMSGVTKSFWYTVLGVWAVGGCALNLEISQPAWLMFGLLAAHSACAKHQGVSKVEQEQKRSYYVEQSAEVWS